MQEKPHPRGKPLHVAGGRMHRCMGKALRGCSSPWTGIGRGQLLPARCLFFLPTSVTSQGISESSGRSLGRLEEYPKPC